MNIQISTMPDFGRLIISSLDSYIIIYKKEKSGKKDNN